MFIVHRGTPNNEPLGGNSTYSDVMLQYILLKAVDFRCHGLF